MRNVVMSAPRRFVGVVAAGAVSFGLAVAGLTVVAAPAAAGTRCEAMEACWYTDTGWKGAQYKIPNPWLYPGKRDFPRYMQDRVTSDWNNGSTPFCVWNVDGEGSHVRLTRTQPGSGIWNYPRSANDKNDYWTLSGYSKNSLTC